MLRHHVVLQLPGRLPLECRLREQGAADPLRHLQRQGLSPEDKGQGIALLRAWAAALKALIQRTGKGALLLRL